MIKIEFQFNNSKELENAKSLLKAFTDYAGNNYDNQSLDCLIQEKNKELWAQHAIKRKVSNIWDKELLKKIHDFIINETDGKC